jgi:hypothetical protein
MKSSAVEPVKASLVGVPKKLATFVAPNDVSIDKMCAFDWLQGFSDISVREHFIKKPCLVECFRLDSSKLERGGSASRLRSYTVHFLGLCREEEKNFGFWILDFGMGKGRKVEGRR